MNTTKERVADATSHVRPYVERAIRDEELRRNVKDAYTSARALYDQLLTRNDVSHVATKLVSALPTISTRSASAIGSAR